MYRFFVIDASGERPRPIGFSLSGSTLACAGAIYRIIESEAPDKTRKWFFFFL